MKFIFIIGIIVFVVRLFNINVVVEIVEYVVFIEFFIFVW